MPEIPPRLSDALSERYRIERPLGSGGMADVYLAMDLRHDRPVALKVLKPELAAMVGAERFLAEIRTTARLQHPHILPLHDSGDADGLLFYVMPFVDGESLRDRLDRERQLPVDDAVRIAKQLAEALDYAHRQGVVHRDLKPANVLMVEGNPVLADFGIALAVGAAGGGRLTETGLSLGTPHYMSPEQATGDGHVGPASDVYALGCVLFEMLSGSPPFVAGTAQAVLGKILTEPVPSVLRERPAVAENVDAVIRTALQKVPADRFRSGADFAAALSNPAYRVPAAGTPASTSSPSWSRTLAAMVATAVVVAVGMRLAASNDAPAAPFQVVAVDVVDLDDPSSVRISPDGRTLLASTGEGLWIRNLADFGWTDLPGTEGALTPRWSPDGEWILFTVGDQVLRMRRTGGPASTVLRLPDACDWPEICGGVWGRDGRVWAVTGFEGVLAAPETGGVAENVIPPGADLHYHLPVPLPGGALLLNVDTDEAGVRWDLWDGESATVIEDFESRVAYGGGFVFHQRGDEIWARPWSAERRAFTGPSEFVAPDAVLLDAADDGSVLAQPIRPGPAPRRELVWVDRQGRETGDVISVGDGTGTVDVEQIGVDGSVLLRDSGRLWITRGTPGGVGATPLPTTNVRGESQQSGVATSDGRLVFIDVDSPIAEGHETPILRADTEARTIDVFVDRGALPSLSADGRTLVYLVGDVGEGRIRMRDLATGEDTEFSAGFPIEFAPRPSPTRPWIAFVAAERPSGPTSAWVARFPDGSGPVLLESNVDGGWLPHWSADGTRVYVSQGGVLQEFRLAEVGGRITIEGRDYLFSIDDEGVGAGTFAVDSAGSRFLLGGLREGTGTGSPSLLLIQNRTPGR